MPLYSYRARDMQGLLITGQLESTGAEELKGYLADKGLIPLSVTRGSGGWNLGFLKKFFQPPVKPAEVLMVTRQFYTLFKAGMGMDAILHSLVRQTSNKRLKEAMQSVRSNVSAGESLSKSFSVHREIFGDLYVSMLEAGEEAGILEGVLKNLCQLLEKEIEIKSSVKSAVLYPKIVIFVLVVASLVVMTMIVPKFTSFYSNFNAQLPLPTRLLIGASEIVQNYFYLIVLGAAGFWIGLRKYAATDSGRQRLGDLRFRVPVFGPLSVKVANSRFCHILSSLYRSGLPVTRCLEITGQTIQNGAFEKEMQTLKDEVTEGKTISEGMESCHYFNPVIVDATAVGEKTGALDDMLDAMGDHYDIEVKHTIKNLTTLLEPFLLFIIFSMVTTFALAIFLPIWRISRAVKGTGM